MEVQGHRAFSGTCDRLTSASEQLKSGSASHLVVREDNIWREGNRMGNHWL
ncbi:hypothetical protein DER44DRAFT_682410 [Fusarium oxysporum]|nr:hypothetical protein DER44DRAFT_682410 [Fusarium oxysporum]